MTFYRLLWAVSQDVSRLYKLRAMMSIFSATEMPLKNEKSTQKWYRYLSFVDLKTK